MRSGNRSYVTAALVRSHRLGRLVNHHHKFAGVDLRPAQIDDAGGLATKNRAYVIGGDRFDLRAVSEVHVRWFGRSRRFVADTHSDEHLSAEIGDRSGAVLAGVIQRVHGDGFARWSCSARRDETCGDRGDGQEQPDLRKGFQFHVRLSHGSLKIGALWHDYLIGGLHRDTQTIKIVMKIVRGRIDARIDQRA